MTEQSFDQTELLAGAKIQHGPYNDRIYLMKLGEADAGVVAGEILERAKRAGYGKVFAKLPVSAAADFLTLGFREEARIPGFFNGCEAAVFLGAYLDPERAQEKDADQLDQVLEVALGKHDATPRQGSGLAAEFTIEKCGHHDVDRMAEIYREVFPTYPFPIHQPDYLLETMRTHVDYFGVVAEGRGLVALSSAEMDREAGNVEMTDFATLPDWRGNGFGVELLWRMEAAMSSEGMPTAYTIARAASHGMNITFAKLGYQYGGRLVNNTNISGRIESMNIWYKELA